MESDPRIREGNGSDERPDESPQVNVVDEFVGSRTRIRRKR